MDGAPAQVVPVLGDVGQVREVAEGADHADGVLAAQAREQPVEVAPGALVALQPVGDRELADPLDELVRCVAFLLADHVAEDAPEQTDVVDQRLVLLRRALGLAFRLALHRRDDAGDVPASMTALRATMAESIVIATRESRLALWQAEHVRALLTRLGDVDVKLLRMTTRGDQILDRTLSKVGGKGLFVKELETALDDGRADIAVHSLKDVPMDLPPGFALAAVLEREDARDALVSSRYAALDELPQGAVVGTSSLRRVVQLAALRPDLRIEPLRGNLDTRLRKLDEGHYDAIVLAAAGLMRLGAERRIRARFETAAMLPVRGAGRARDRGARRRRRAARTARRVHARADAPRRRRRARGLARARRQLQHAAGRARRLARRHARARRGGRPSAERAAPLLRVQTSGGAVDERAAESLGGAAARALLAAGAAPYLAAAERLAASPDAP